MQDQYTIKKTSPALPRLCAGLAAALLLGVAAPAGAQSSMTKAQKMKMQKMQKLKALDPAKGYLKAHKGNTNPYNLLGGPISVQIGQDGGPVYVALPSKRQLDPTVFGTPLMPRDFGGPPIAEGIPPMLRGHKNGAYTTTTVKTPFGDKYTTLRDGHLSLQSVDATATDAAVTDDTVHMTASWKDAKGNIYEVTCAKVEPYGSDHPTFGGVVTNTLMHGFTRIGTPLEPTQFVYYAFWGKGDISKNGKVLDTGRLIHGMLTEDVRTNGYRLATDSQVNPHQVMFHLILPPMKKGKKDPIKTGFTMANGKPLPFWHVMFQTLTVSAERDKNMASAR